MKIVNKANQLRTTAYKILSDNRNIPWIEMWQIDIAACYLEEAQKLEKSIVRD